MSENVELFSNTAIPKMKFFLFFIIVFLTLTNGISAQGFLNGSFENNTAGATDQINLSNAGFNGFMANTNAFGTAGNMDIIRTATWGGSGAQHLTWYVSLTGNGTDAIAMTLCAPLVAGTTYTISFWDRKDPGYPAFPLQLSLSTTNNTIGTTIYTAPVAPTNNVWTQRTFSFVAPNNGQFIVVTQNGGGTGAWVHVDNFVMNNSSPTGNLSIVASTNTICAGSSATFTASGAASYTWTPATALSSTTAAVVTASPNVTTTYSVNGTSGSCVFTGSITLNVVSSPTITVTPTLSSGCSGASFNLTANGSTSYTWTPNTALSSTTGSMVTASPMTTTSYTVVGGVGSCTNSAVAIVSVVPNATISVTPSLSTICSGSSATLTAAGSTTYTWSPSATLNATNGAIVVATPGNTTTYTVISGSGTCTNSAIATVSVAPTPTLALSPSSGICVGSSATLTASGATAYTWAPSGSLNASTGSTVIATPVVTTNYTVTGVNGICTNMAVTTVSVVSSPVLTLSPPTSTICAGSSVTLTATGSTVYTWTPSTGLSTTTGSVVVASPPVGTTVYTVTGGVGTCTAVVQASVTVNALPSLTLTPVASVICAGTSATLTASGATSYSWSPASGLSASTGSVVVATPAASTVYSITGAINSCTAVATTTVNVIANPTLNIVANTTLCAGTSANLTVSGASTYTWSPATGLSTSTGSVVTASPAATQVYTITGTLNTCTAVASTTVTVVPFPVLVMGPDAAICSGSSATISASGATTYIWSPSTGLSSTTGGTVTASPGSSTGYTVTGTTSGCSSTGSLAVNVTPTPTLNVTASPSSMCRGLSSSLAVSGAANYTWSPSGALSDVNLPATTASPVQTTTYTVIGANGLCTSSATVELVVIQTATVQASKFGDVCFGESTTIEAIGGTTYSWLPVSGLSHANAASTDAGPLVTTVYTMTASGPGLCPSTSTVEVKVNPLPHVYAGRDTTINIDETITLTGTGDVEVGFLSPTSTPLACNFCNAITVNPQEPTCYVLKGENGYGCVDYDTVCVYVTKDFNVYIPNAFTPNEDGYNDVFIPVGYGINEIRLTIFDRWGEQIFTSNETSIGWDGSRKGKQCEQGVYVYKAEVKTMAGHTVQYVGHVTLLPKSIAK